MGSADFRKSPTATDFLTESCSVSVQLLNAVQQCDLRRVQELLPLLNSESVNTPFGPLQITVLQFACSLAPDKVTPLVKLLISYGANVVNKDKLGRTALHYAASSGSPKLVQLLIDNGAITDSKYEINSLSRNPQIPDDFGISKVLPLPECWGRTPLHLAVKGNHKEVVKILLKSGASVNVADEHGITPLLLAGAGIHVNTLPEYEEIVSLLISFHADVNAYNSSIGTTALHHAVSLNSFTATKSLLEAGAVMKDGGCGQTPIHEAAGRGYYNILELLLHYENISINRPDHAGRTALHKAAFAGSRDCVRLLIDYGGDLSVETKSRISVMDLIFSHIPRPLHLLNDVLNSKITCNDVSVNDVNFKVTLDFKMLSPRGADRQMSVVSAMLGAGNDHQSLELLQHPLLETFLYLKWARLRIFFILLVIIHMTFVMSLSVYILLIVHHSPSFEFAIAFSRNILLLSALTLFTHALIQCLLVPRHYFKQYEMWLNLLCAFFSFVIAIAGTEQPMKTESGETILSPPHWVLHTASIVVLVAWIELMLLMGRFPTYGYYALMFSTVLQNVVKVLLTFVCLVIGFALSFSVQFHTFEQFQDPWRALVKTTVMMMGEFEYGDLFADRDDSNPIRLPATSRLIFILFIILSSIVLMNLMVGLAVSDIQGLQTEGHVKRLAKQATFLSHLEKVLSHRFLKSDWFPTDLYQFLYTRRCFNVILVLKPGKKGASKDMENNRLAKYIPMPVLEKIINVALNNTTFSCIPEDSHDNKRAICEIISMLKELQSEVKSLKSALATNSETVSS